MKFNFEDYFKFLYKKITVLIDHSYPNGTLKEQNIHTSLQSLKAVFDAQENLIAGLNFYANKDDKMKWSVIDSFGAKSKKIILKCYPNGTLGEWMPSHLCLSNLYIIRDLMDSSVEMLNLKTGNIPFSELMEELFDHTHVYNYLVENKRVVEGKLHIACQISMNRLIITNGILENVYESNKDSENADFIKKVLDQSKSVSNNFLEAYPNNQLNNSVAWTVFKLCYNRIGEIQTMIKDNKHLFSSESINNEEEIAFDPNSPSSEYIMKSEVNTETKKNGYLL